MRGKNRKKVFLGIFSPPENESGVHFPVKNLVPALVLGGHPFVALPFSIAIAPSSHKKPLLDFGVTPLRSQNHGGVPVEGSKEMPFCMDIYRCV
jgi:hypothetical protein